MKTNKPKEVGKVTYKQPFFYEFHIDPERKVVLELPVPFGALSKVERKQIIKWIKEELNHVVKMNESRAYSLYEMHSNEANRIKKEWGFND